MPSPSIYMGSNSLEELSHLYPNKKFHIWHIPELQQNLLRKIKGFLGHRIVSQNVYDFGMPDVEMVSKLNQQFSKTTHAHDSVILAIGGGSLMDFAKVIRFKSEKEDWWLNCLNKSLDVVPAGVNKLPLILVPSTAGTGSEVTGTATIWDFENGSKSSFFGSEVYAECAIIDPQLTHDAPWTLTRDSGLDALSHALESIWNKNSTAETIATAIKAAQKICIQLPILKNDLSDLHAREEMSEAAFLAGISMSKTQTALAHALSYDDTITNGESHGYACAKWLPAVWALIYAKSSNTSTNGFIQEAIGAHMSNPQEMFQWLENLGVRSHHPEYLTEGQKHQMIEALNSVRGKNFIGSVQ